MSEDRKLGRREFAYSLLACSAGVSLLGNSSSEEESDPRLEQLRSDLENLETQAISLESDDYNAYFDHRSGSNDEVPLRVDLNMPEVSQEKLSSDEYLQDGAQIFSAMVDNFWSEDQIGYFMIDYSTEPAVQEALQFEPDYSLSRSDIETYLADGASTDDIYRQTISEQI